MGLTEPTHFKLSSSVFFQASETVLLKQSRLSKEVELAGSPQIFLFCSNIAEIIAQDRNQTLGSLSLQLLVNYAHRRHFVIF